MKRILLIGALALATSVPALVPASAADLPPPAPAPRAPAAYVPAPVFSWTGFYIGINYGWAFGQSSWSTPLGGVGNFSTDGALAGGTIGGNYQIGQFVLGVEGDGDWQNVRGSQTSTPCVVGVFGCATASTWIATIRGRAGFAVDRTLFYITGGGAFANVKPSTGSLPYGGGTEAGWTAGGGIEYAITNNWTTKLEYLYASFQNASCGVGSCGALAPATVSLNENIIRGGINYKF